MVPLEKLCNTTPLSRNQPFYFVLTQRGLSNSYLRLNWCLKVLALVKYLRLVLITSIIMVPLEKLFNATLRSKKQIFTLFCPIEGLAES